MLIYLLPDGPHPRVYHTVNFTDPYNRVPLPNNWASQLHCLHMDELDLPTATHALDKACWLTAIIDELVFDMVSQTVSCSFSNGPTLQWSLRRQPACVAALEDVLADLAQSRNEQDKERAATQPSPKATTPKQRHVSLPPPVLTKSAKHKKQRSLLSSLISSFNKLGSGTPPPDVPTTPSPSRSSFSPPSSPSRVCWKLAADFLPPSQKTPLAQTLSRPLSIVLQARARSRLVDAFRRFVLAEVKARITPNGYAHWAARCMLRRSENHMAWLVQESGGVFPDLTRPMPPSRMTSALSGKTLVSVGDASTEEDGDDELDRCSLTPSMSTETDGSSIHTPVDSPSHSPFAPPPPPKHTGSTAQRMPRSPSPAEFTAEDWATYQSLNAQCMRLRQLLVRMDAARADTEQDERNFQAVLEVKSRRRAWSNRAYMGGAPLSGIGLALPFRSSPLARCESVTPELLCTTLLEVSTGDHNIATLFPVSEEDEEDDDSVPFSLAPDAALRDLESGLLPPLTRPQMRARTHSMHPMHALDVDLPLCPDPPKLLVPPQPPPMTATRPMTPTPPLYQPLNKPLLETQTKCELFERAERGGEDDESGLGVGVRVGPEFTLAMDLPPPYARTVGAEHNGWIDSREEVSC